MIRHCVLLTWKPEVTDEQIDDLIKALQSLPTIIPEIQSYKLGRDLGAAEGNASLAITADFDDLEGWRTYTDDAKHQQIINEHILPILEGRCASQFTL